MAEYCRERGWDFSISVTHEKFKEPLREEVSCLSEDDWQWINDDRIEEAAIICHQPQGWKEMESYVVVRSWWDGAQRRLSPRHIFIDLVRVPARLVRRGRSWTVRFAKTVLRLDWLAHAADRLDELCAAPS